MLHVRVCQFQIFFNLNNFIVNNILKCLRFDVLCYAFLALSMQMISMCCRYFSIFAYLIVKKKKVLIEVLSTILEPWSSRYKCAFYS